MERHHKQGRRQRQRLPPQQCSTFRYSKVLLVLLAMSMMLRGGAGWVSSEAVGNDSAVGDGVEVVATEGSGSEEIATTAARVRDLEARLERTLALEVGSLVRTSAVAGEAYRYRLVERIRQLGAPSGFPAVASQMRLQLPGVARSAEQDDGAALVLRQLGTLQACDAGRLTRWEAEAEGMCEAPALCLSVPADHQRARQPSAAPAVTAGAHGEYTTGEQVGRGAHGEVWRATRVAADGAWEDGVSYVLKRIYRSHAAAQLSGRREVYFGGVWYLAGSPHVARYVESWEEEEDGHLWLAFHDEGQSLQQLLFNPVAPSAGVGGAPEAAPPAGGCMLHGSALWVELSTKSGGPPFIQGLVHALLSVLAEMAAEGAVHRDVKAANILVWKDEVGAMSVRLADFGSAVDADSLVHMYPSGRATQLEETLEYAPPEVRMSDAPYDPTRPASYDVFSVGMVVLEVLLGRPARDVLQVPPRAEARIRAQAASRDDAARNRTVAALAAVGIEPCPGSDVAPCLARFRTALRRLGRTAEAAARACAAQTSQHNATGLVVRQDGAVVATPAEDGAAAALVPVPPFSNDGGSGSGGSGGVSIDALPAPPQPQLALSPSAPPELQVWPEATVPSAASAHDAPLRMLTEAGEELLFHMLRWEADARITAADALQHPWMANLNSMAGVPVCGDDDDGANAMQRNN